MTRSPRIEDVSEVIWEPKFIRCEQAHLSNCQYQKIPLYGFQWRDILVGMFAYMKITFFRLLNSFRYRQTITNDQKY